MTGYVHHIPGRLRVRCAAIKRDQARAAALKRLLAQQSGVKSVETSELTGSVVVHYDVARIQPAALVALLHERGYDTPPRSASSRPPVQIDGGAVARAVASTLLQAAIERSLLALIAAVL